MSSLHRALGLRAAVAVGVGGTVGGGVFVLVGVAARDAGPAALAAFGIAFAAALLIALPYAELACRYPLAGGGYAFARAVFGPAWGFLMGWGYWGAYVFVSGYVTLGFGGYLHAITGVPRVAGALALVAACLGVNLAGVRLSGRVQTAIVGTAIAGLVAFAAWGAPNVDPARLHPFLHHGATGLATAALVAFLAFGGFDMVAAAGEEVRSPERNLPRAILITLATVLGLYLLVTAVAIGVMSTSSLGASPAPLAAAAGSFGGPAARELVVATALVTTAATANAVLLVTSRIAFAMARDGAMPRRLAATGRRTGAPWPALLANAALLSAVALTGSVRLAAAIGGFLYVLHFVPPLVALVVLRRRGEGDPAFLTPWPRVVVPLAFGACAALLVAGGVVGAAGGVAWLGLGLAARSLSRVRRRPVPRRVGALGAGETAKRQVAGVSDGR
jgi:APA family basic amino acid/polyamine antiporter